MKVVRRVFGRPVDGAQVLVEVWANDSGEPVVKVALRSDEWDTWSAPLPEILNEDEP